MKNTCVLSAEHLVTNVLGRPTTCHKKGNVSIIKLYVCIFTYIGVHIYIIYDTWVLSAEHRIANVLGGPPTYRKKGHVLIIKVYVYRCAYV